MTSRQARRLRREEERKAKKAAYKSSLRASVTPVTPAQSLPAAPVLPPTTSLNPDLFDEFTPEFLAYANSMRERIARNIALTKQNTLSSERLDEPASLREAKTQAKVFVSQDDLQSHNASAHGVGHPGRSGLGRPLCAIQDHRENVPLQ